MERLNSDFLEKVILKGMLTDRDFLILVSSVYEDRYFDDPSVQHAFRFCKEYADEYHRVPPKDAVINSSDNSDDIREMIEQAEQAEFNIAEGYEFLLEETNNYLKEKALKQAIIDSVDEVEDPELRPAIQKRIEEALIKDVKIDLGLRYFNDIGVRLRKVFTASDQRIPTYFPAFDEIINGGFPSLTFNVLTAKIHGGKCVYNNDITIKINDKEIKKININNFYKYIYENEYLGEKQMPSLQSFINKNGEKLGKVKFDKWRKKISKSRKGITPALKGKKMDGFFIEKYGEDEGLKRYNIWLEKQKENGKKGKGKRTLGYYIEKYGDEKGREIYNKSSEKRSKSAKNINTLGYYIEKHGDIEGREKYQEKNEKISDIGRGSLEWFIKKHGDIEGREKYDLYIKRQKLSSKKCIEYWLNKGFTEEEAKEKISENQTIFSKEICIEKYGEEEGLKRWKERQEKWQNTLNSKSLEEIERINRAKLCNTLIHNGYSQISQELFWELYNRINNNFKEIYFAQLDKDKKEDFSGYNNEYFLRFENKNIFPDFFIKDKNKIIEFDGDYWHGEARGNQKKDKERDDMIIDAGYKILHIKERDYKNNQEEVIKKCMEFVYD